MSMITLPPITTSKVSEIFDNALAGKPDYIRIGTQQRMLNIYGEDPQKWFEQYPNGVPDEAKKMFEIYFAELEARLTEMCKLALVGLSINQIDNVAAILNDIPDDAPDESVVALMTVMTLGAVLLPRQCRSLIAFLRDWVKDPESSPYTAHIRGLYEIIVIL